MRFENLPVGAFQANAWLVWDEGSGKAVLVDPGDEADRLLAWIREKGVQVEALLATHGHLDHVSAAGEVSEALGGIPFLMHGADRFLLETLGETRRQFGLPPKDPPELDRVLSGGETLPVGSGALRVLHVPGHSPGSVAFLDESGGFLLTGDLLFKGSVGRTDLPGGDAPTLFDSIRKKVLTLPGSTRILPGHGPATTIHEEKEHNPFLLGILDP